MAEAERRQRFEELYRENHGAVRGYLLRRADPETAGEALSETFLAAWRRLDKLPPDALPWLLGTARKTLANQRRSSRRLSALRDRAAGAEMPAGGDPAEQAGETELVRRALGELAERDREALLLVAWEDLELAMRERTLLDLDPGPREQADVRIDYLRYERLPVTDANKRLLEMSPHPGADRLP